MTKQLCLVYIPALVVILQNAEMKKGSPLTESEVLKICDEATCIVLPFDIAMKSEMERGYRDIVAEDCWNEWQQFRASLQE